MAIFSGLLCISVTTDSFSDDGFQVGATDALLSATPDGQATFSIDIEMPPGIAGLVPQVRIDYLSRGGTGLVGSGGRIHGFSMITRCPSTIPQDGFVRGVMLTMNDRFCLDGQRMVLVEGIHGQIASEYRLELDPFKKITVTSVLPYPDGVLGPESFTLTSRNGVRTEYGNTAESRIQSHASAPIHSWGVSRVEDNYGNTMTYQYHDFSSMVTDSDYSQIERLPAKIEYGSNKSQNVDAVVSVDFEYEVRPDLRSFFYLGTGFKQTQRVSRITTHVDDTLVREYRLTYDQSVFSMQSRLITVQECASSNDCFPPTEISWAEADGDWSVDDLWQPPDDLYDENGRRLGNLVDLNGDGRVDWITAVEEIDGTQSLWTWLNTDTGWVREESFRPPSPLSRHLSTEQSEAKLGETIDLNGDGLVDWVTAWRQGETEVVQTWINNSNGWSESASYRLPAALTVISNSNLPQPHAELVDLNADALPDIVLGTTNAHGVTVIKTWMNTGAGWQPSESHRLPEVLSNYSMGNSASRLGTFVDLNADGLVDLVRSYIDSSGAQYREAWMNTGTSWEQNEGYRPPTVSISYQHHHEGLLFSRFIDLNGDHLPDLLVSRDDYVDGIKTEKRSVWLNTGVGWEYSQQYLPTVAHWRNHVSNAQNDQGTSMLGFYQDMNRDGLIDLVRAFKDIDGTEYIDTWVNTGSGWRKQGILDLPVVFKKISRHENRQLDIGLGFFADMNSDGMEDFVISAKGEPRRSWAFGLGNRSYAVPETVIKTENGFGFVSQVQMKPPTHVPGMYIPSLTRTYPLVPMNRTGPLVSELETSDGLGGWRRLEFEYGEKKVDLIGRRNPGFGSNTAIDRAKGIRTVTTLMQEYPHAGRISNVKKYVGDVLISEVRNSYQFADEHEFVGIDANFTLLKFHITQTSSTSHSTRCLISNSIVSPLLPTLDTTSSLIRSPSCRIASPLFEILADTLTSSKFDIL